MRQANNNIATFLVLQQIRRLLCRFYRIIINHTFTFIGLHQSFHLRSKTKDTDLQSVATESSIRFHQSFQYRTCYVIVGTYHREVCHTEQTCHILQTEIKLMITNRHGIVAHKVHHLDFYFPLEQIIVRSSLGDISTVEQQQIRVHLARLFNKGGPSHGSAHTGIAVGSIYSNRLNAAMCVTCLQNHQLFGFLCRVGSQQTKGFLRDFPGRLLC